MTRTAGSARHTTRVHTSDPRSSHRASTRRAQRIRWLAVVAAIGAFTALTPTAASAGTGRVKDPKGDVRTMPYGAFADYPIDIRSVRASYDDTAHLTVVMRFWSLEKDAWNRSMISIFDAANPATYIQAEKNPGQPVEVRRMQYGPQPEKCKARFTADYSALTMTFVVPATCINRWTSIEVDTSVFRSESMSGWVDYGAAVKVQG